MQSILSPLLYIRRNPTKALPIVMVVTLSVMLIYSVVTLVGSVNTTIFTLYGYNRFVAGLLPRNVLSLDPDEVKKAQNMEGMGLLAETHNYTIQVKTIFGKMFFPLFGVKAEVRQELMRRCGVVVKEGRLPEEGKPEAVVSSEIARNLGLKLGDYISKPESEDNYAPAPIKLVGVLDGPVWLGFTSKQFIDEHSPFILVGYMAFAKPGYPQAKLDYALDHGMDKGKVRVWVFTTLVREAQTSLSNLYLILNLVTGTIMIAIAFVCALLSNIYFTQRLPEVATLSAIGYSMRQLLVRAVGETFCLCLIGWFFGVLASLGFLRLIYVVLLEPKGLLLSLFDPATLLFTIPLPITIGFAAWLTLAVRLKHLDPVSIIERRA